MARTRCVLEMTCAFGCAVLAVLTLAVHDWIEVVFGVSPDRGSGLGEVAIVGTLLVLSLASAADVVRIRRMGRARA